MNGILVFAAKSAVYLTVFYLVYFLFLSRDTSYSRNRAYIIISMLLSLALPLFSLRTSDSTGIQAIGKWFSEVLITGKAGDKVSGPGFFQNLFRIDTLYTIYIIGMCLYLIKLLTDLGNLLMLISRHRKADTNIIRFHTFKTAGFSALGYIFLNSSLSPEEEKEIIRHEENHLRKNHFIDVIFIGIIRAFQWFNPVIYLLDRSLRAIHEYQADRGCIDSGVAVTSYQNLLLNQVFRIRSFNLANSFSNPSLLRKRMVMMTRKPTAAIASLKMIFVLPAAIFTFLIISAYDVTYRNDKTDTTMNRTKTEVQYGSDVFNTVSEKYKEVPFTVVDKMPIFPGGDVALLQYLAANTVYPEAAKENNIQGRVIIRFCVNQDGGVDRISVLKGVDPELDAEAVRVVSTLPAFIPGSDKGKAVPVWYMVPLTFALR